MNAFPTPPGKEPLYRFVNGVLEYEGSPGMSLRDYFAAKAMQGTVAVGDRWINHCDTQYIAELSYAMADAMLKARGS